MFFLTINETPFGNSSHAKNITSLTNSFFPVKINKNPHNLAYESDKASLNTHFYINYIIR